MSPPSNFCKELWKVREANGNLRNPILSSKVLLGLSTTQCAICVPMIFTLIFVLDLVSVTVLVSAILTALVAVVEMLLLRHGRLSLTLYMAIESAKSLAWLILTTVTFSFAILTNTLLWITFLPALANCVICALQFLHGAVVYPRPRRTQRQQQRNLPQHNTTLQFTQPQKSGTPQLQQTQTNPPRNDSQPGPISLRQVSNSPSAPTQTLPQVPPPCTTTAASDKDDKYAFLRDL